jgi:enamine deaminase RidA (YjgF/YER057c/UK114 family)
MQLEDTIIKPRFFLPAAPKPAGSYKPWILAGNLLYISGQFPIQNGRVVYTGRVGDECTEADGYAAARLSALNVLAQIHAALKGFDSLTTLLRVEGHIASAPGWHNAPKVLDGASELFNEVLGERGRHTRTAFTPTQLPLKATVELVVTAEVEC